MTSIKKTIRKAVFPVGGFGTRFLPATKAIPKEMLPVLNKPVIQYIFEEARNAGIEEFIFIIGRNKNVITNHFDYTIELEQILENKFDIAGKTKDWLPEPGSIVFIRQQEPLGLGHAIWCARNVVNDEPFAVLLPDEMFFNSDRTVGILSDLIRVSCDHVGKNWVAVDEVTLKDANRYGIVTVDAVGLGDANRILQMEEKPLHPKSNLAIVGRYILQPQIFEFLASTQKGDNNEIQLTDAMSKMLCVSEFYAHKISAKRVDCGLPIGLLEANLEAYLMDLDNQSQFRSMIDKFYKKNFNF